MTDADIFYYRRRLAEEEARAAEAGERRIAAVHRQMAERYRALLGSAASSAPA